MKTTHVFARSLTVALLCCAFVVSGCTTGRVNHEGAASIDKPGGDHRAKVVSRLIEVGYSEKEAAARADAMTDAELVYFAGNPEAVRRSGFVILSSLIGSSIWSSAENKKDKRMAYSASLNSKILNAQMEISSKTMLLVNESDPAKKMWLEAQIKVLEENSQSLKRQLDLADATE
jgi:hypothetical protein